MSDFDTIGARLAIIETLNRYAWSYDTRDLALMAETFTVDASFAIKLAGSAGWGPYEGRQTIIDWLAGIMQTQSDQRRHCVTNIIFRALDRQRASVDSYLSLTAVENGLVRLVTTGTYRDEMINEDGIWCIERKTLVLDGPF